MFVFSVRKVLFTILWCFKVLIILVYKIENIGETLLTIQF